MLFEYTSADLCPPNTRVRAVPASYGRQKHFRPPPSGHPVFQSHSYILHAFFFFPSSNMKRPKELTF
ncbi:Uncharacterized protein APZ42_029589 [Daphnia magna]|uniref:Uncharacterized protein n=1 Tax=Daphnia magna TaxID=35525 RepID=A0A164PPC0_9CRUS|nr:Uncharacterized protein APZ42_029589 [Daphnia magna]